jgi:hypothetical protein
MSKNVFKISQPFYLECHLTLFYKGFGVETMLVKVFLMGSGINAFTHYNKELEMTTPRK